MMFPLKRVWPNQQPCVFVLSLKYFRTRKPHKTRKTLHILLRGDVVSDRSSLQRPVFQGFDVIDASPLPKRSAWLLRDAINQRTN